MTDPYAPYLDWIDKQHDALVEQLITWSRINSGSRHLAGLERMGAELEKSFAALGGEIETLALAPMEVVGQSGQVEAVPLGRALRMVKRPGARHRVFLGGHMDTVFGADHPFQDTAWRDRNTLVGPGAADLKGGLLVMRTALEALERSPWAEAVGWEVLLNPDEEIGSPGSAPLLEAAARRNHMGLVYEPALPDGTLAGARKGSGNFAFVVRGRAAHAGREHPLGRNAVAALSRLIAAVDALNGERAGVTVNPARIQGGGALNIVPDLAIGHLNVRVQSAEEQAWVEETLARLQARFGAEDGIEVTLHGGFSRPPKTLTQENLVLFEMIRECGQALGVPIDWQPTGGCCDGNNLAAGGLPNVDTLGVRGGGIHTSEEFILVDSLTERARLSALLLMRLGAGELIWPEDTQAGAP
ncbi:MAG: hydrolase [Gammaproteobacteria bacterium]|nr:hydrolase [Gammaproteobacteria bacterium]NIR81661.1 hydrolase [Gammaproteobacteria bacterium]NIR88212.1 hydrolase [Gammaproteobacteria bacterium]NIU02773.1 hydrolase [Gammaproteobacteria bacterium]NIV73372.1 hydrolase [Gammaproteobacteria bacterium]